jgi:hypothetical protein
MMTRVLVFGFAALTLAACNDTVAAGTTSGGGTTTGSSTAGGTTTGGNVNPSGGVLCTGADPSVAASYYPGGPQNPNLGYFAGQTFPDIALGGGYWNLSYPTPVDDCTNSNCAADTNGFYKDQLNFHDLYCSGKFKVALVDISALWCNPCNIEGQDLPIHATGTWLPQGGVIFSILAEGAVEGSHTVAKGDLDTWIGRHNTNYPIVMSLDSLVAAIIQLPSWPTNIIINLRDMTVLESFQGYTPCSGSNCSDQVYTKMTQYLTEIQ